MPSERFLGLTFSDTEIDRILKVICTIKLHIMRSSDAINVDIPTKTIDRIIFGSGVI